MEKMRPTPDVLGIVGKLNFIHTLKSLYTTM